jgi:hypothetical protein
MIRKDLSNLPKADAPKGVQPDRDPFIGRAVTSLWMLDNIEPNKPHAMPSMFRFSMAGTCSRSLAYYASGTTPTNLPDAADNWRMGLGTMIHEVVQRYVEDAIVESEDLLLHDDVIDCSVVANFEQPVYIEECDASGSADIVLDFVSPGGNVKKRVVVELKTINGFGFKMAATGFKGPAEGPRISHVQQAALQAYGLEADEVVICYLSMENVSPSIAASYCDDQVFGRFTAQWTYKKHEWLPYAEREIARLKSIKSSLHDGQPTDVERLVYNDAGNLVAVNDPRTGAYHVTDVNGQIVDAGKTWNCSYCRFQSQCIGDS